MLPFNKHNFVKLFSLVVLVVLAGAVIFLYLKYTQAKYAIERAVELKKSLPQEDLEKLIPSPSPGVEIQSGDDTTAAKVTGKLTNLYTEGDSNFLNMITKVNGKTFVIKANLGDDDFLIAEKTTEYNKEALQLIEKYQNKRVGDIMAKYKDKIGQQITIVVPTQIDTSSYKSNCDDVCAKSLRLFNLYKTYNQDLANTDNIRSNIITVGLVTQISI